jgi:hypothetical protein
MPLYEITRNPLQLVLLITIHLSHPFLLYSTQFILGDLSLHLLLY